MFGSHLSVAGGLEHALAEAKALGCDCVQIFTRNQRRWDNPPISKGEIARWNEGLAALGWDQPGSPRVVSHNSYLVNLAAPSGETRTRSIKAQRQELERCEALGIELCVAHPGAHLGEAPSKKTSLPLGEPPSDDELAGLERIVEALDRIHRDLPGFRVRTLLETTVGSGTNLGYDFGHLAMIRERVAETDRVGFCFDTCHVTAAGWDMTTPTKAAAVLARFDATCGLARIGAFHMNDSKGAVGSRLDRHAHIGEGTCGRACFRAICGDARFASIPKILETPKELDADQVPWDAVNLKRLRAMSRAPKAASKSGARASRPKDAEARRGSRGSAKPARTGGRRKA